MARALAPAKASIPGVSEPIELNVLPDPFDARDLLYRPRLHPLEPVMDQRGERHVMLQKGSSCTGHALAAMINHVTRSRVSPYMLYYLGRRYDEWAGETDTGSSLRGGLKGWFHHGVCLSNEWPRLRYERSLDDPAFLAHCSERPLGAFYRVDARSLDDLQSAITELNAIVVSAAIHEGWITPRVLRRGEETVHLIVRRPGHRELGGHAFAIVGYNDTGFLVQNSWGTGWGKGGFATLSYEDWVQTGYDAWVARPGVPRTPFASGAQQAGVAAAGTVLVKGVDVQRLRPHIVNLTNNGELSTYGRVSSTPEQVRAIVTAMSAYHEQWISAGVTERRDVVLYAHGGLVSEKGGLTVAEKHLPLWLGHAVYPVNFVWESGSAETLGSHVADLLRGRTPAAGLGDALVEQFDRMVEGLARRSLRWMWREMKENARSASAASKRGLEPGATLFVDALTEYVQAHPDVRVHLVGHSAGSIFHGALLERLEAARIRVESLALLAPAIRVDEFVQRILPRLGQQVQRFACFVLSDQRELDDTCGAGPITPYRKSLLYLVSRALEPAVDDSLSGNAHRRKRDVYEVPLLGMERFLTAELRAHIAARNGEIVVAPSTDGPGHRSDSRTHGGFDDDADTMRSVLVRILGTEAVPSAAAAAEPMRRATDYQTLVVLKREAEPVREAPLVERMLRSGMWQEVPPPRRDATPRRRDAR